MPNIFEADLDALQNLIYKLQDTSDKLNQASTDLYTAGTNFFYTFQSPEKVQAEDEYNDMLRKLHQAQDCCSHNLTFFQALLTELQGLETRHYFPAYQHG